MPRLLVRWIASLALALGSAAALAEFPIAVQATAKLPDGDILIAGKVYNGTLGFARLTADGTRDFNYPFQAVNSYPADDVTGMILLADGRMVFSAENTPSGGVVLVGVDASGNLVPAFGSNGIAVDTQTTGLRIKAIAPGANGSILAFGTIPANTWEDTTAVVVRFNADGSRDLTYGTAGVIMPAGQASAFRAAVALPDGSVIAAGFTNNVGVRQAALVKIGADGTVDTSFGDNGVATTPLDGSPAREANGIALVGGDVVIAGREGYSYQPGFILMARFSTSGAMVYAASRGVPAAQADVMGTAVLALDSNAYIIGGSVLMAFRDNRRVLVRYPSGEVVMETGDAPYVESISALHAAPGGEVLVLGTRSDYYPSARRTRHFTDNLEYDTDFAQEGHDSTPNPITIPGVTGGVVGQVYTSAPFRVSGIDQVAYASVSGGSYSPGCTEPYTTDPLNVTNGQVLCLRVTATGGTATATVTVNGVQGTFSVIAVGPPDTYFTVAPATDTGRLVVFYYAGEESSGPITGYECRLDADPFVPCPMNNHVGVGPLSVGPHTFEVRAINSYGTDPSPALASFTVHPPPETTITSGPGAVSGSSVTFAFASSESGSMFLCYLDGQDSGPYESCTSPKTYSNLAGGSHTFRAIALGNYGSDPTPATLTWTVDRTAPDTRIVTWPGNAMYTATATFTYDAFGEANVTFECQLDGGAWYACPGGSASVTVAPDVSHTFSVRAIDEWGNVDATPVTRGWIYFSQPPDTIIDSGPSGTVNLTTATFSYHGTNNPSLMECSMAGPTGNPAFTNCGVSGSSQSYFNLAEGTYTFSVRSRTNDGTVDATPAQRTIIVDRTAPTTTITSGPSATVGSASATLEFAANESGVTFICRLDGGTAAACTSPATFSGLADGSHTFTVSGFDLAGNAGASTSRTWQVDQTAPDTTITSAPSGTVASASASIAFTSESGALFDCRLDNAAFAACTSPVAYSGLADGAHTFQVRARDAIGNVDATPATATWTVDTTAPDTSIASGPSGTVAVASATFTFQSTDPGATFECSLDGLAFASCSPGVSYSGLANGMHMFDVRSRDAAGNVDATPAERTWSVDTTAPNTTITSGPAAATTSTSATFAFSSTEAGTFYCALDGAQYATCSSPVTYAGLSAASHAFAVYSVDGAGNADASPSTWSWIVDNQAPQTTITANPPAAINSTSASFSFTSSEAGGTFECKLDAGAFAACTSPRAYSGLAAGSHTFQVRASDALGNQDATPATFTWTIDTTAPNTTITGGPSGNNNPNTATFAFTSTEVGTFECRLDGAAFAACASGITYTGLVKGQHTFDVRAIDAAGNVDASPATRTWRSN